MTKKHFAALATELFDVRPPANWNPNKSVQWNLDCRAVIHACMMLNPRFDKDRFIDAITRGYPKPDDFIWY